MTWVAAGVGIGTAVFGGASAKRQKKKQDALVDANAASELERDQRISQTRGQIDAVFDAPARQRQHAEFANALRGYLGQQLGTRKVDTSRNLKFALAKQGLTGGSAAVDSNKRLGDEFADAAIGNERNVQGAVAGLRGQDEATRLSLHQLAANGMGLSTAGRRTSEALRQNLATADNDARILGLGDVFAQTAGTYKAINERAAQRRGYGYNASRADLYGGRG